MRGPNSDKEYSVSQKVKMDMPEVMMMHMSNEFYCLKCIYINNY